MELHKKTFVITPSCPDRAIIQHLSNGDYDFSEFGSIESAVRSGIFKDSIEVFYGGDTETAWSEIAVSMNIYNREEILQAAKDEYHWPIDLGFVMVVESR